MNGLTTQQRKAPRATASKPGPIEPPAVKHLAVWVYRAAGREDLRLPRLMRGVNYYCGKIVAAHRTSTPPRLPR
jgi:hypothetical protein